MISVLMTTYNCAIYIEQAIRSILNQTYKDFGFIVIDDGSTDNSQEILASFKDKRINFYKVEHIGRSKALNFGFERCNNDFIAIMDADDVAHPERLEKQYEFLLENSNIDIVGSWANLINQKGELIGTLKKPLDECIIKNNLLTMNGISFGTSLIRYSKVHFKYFNENLTFGEDLEWFYKNSWYNSYSNLPNKLMDLRQRDGSLSRNKKNDYKELSCAISSFINLELNDSKSYQSQNLLIRDLALTQYYFGRMPKSFWYFIKVLFMNPFDVTNLRYLFASAIMSLFGDSFRQNSFFRTISNSFRNLFIR